MSTDLTLIRMTCPVSGAPIHVVTVKSVPLPTPSEFLKLRKDSHSVLFFLFIGQEPTTRPVNNFLQIMVCSCAISSNCVLAINNVLLMRKWNHSFLLLVIALAWKWQIASLTIQRAIFNKKQAGDRMIRQLLNSVLAKYRYFSVSRRSIICLSCRLRPNYNWSARHWQIMIFCSTSSNNCQLLLWLVLFCCLFFAFFSTKWNLECEWQGHTGAIAVLACF